jgi:hypothetical protein
VAQRYARHLPLMTGPVQAVRRMAAVWSVGLASSRSRPVSPPDLTQHGRTDRANQDLIVHASMILGNLTLREGGGQDRAQCEPISDSKMWLTNAVRARDDELAPTTTTGDRP